MTSIQQLPKEDIESISFQISYPNFENPLNEENNITEEFKIEKDVITKHSHVIEALVGDCNDDSIVPIPDSIFHHVEHIVKDKDGNDVTTWLTVKPSETIIRILDFCREYKDVALPQEINNKDENKGWDMSQFDDNYIAKLNIDDHNEMMSLIKIINFLHIDPFWFLIRDYCASEIKKLPVEEQKNIWKKPIPKTETEQEST